MGRLQINVFDADCFPFINMLKYWDSVPSTGDNYPADLNADGYPTVAPSSDIAGTLNPFPASYTGSMVLKWTGTGSFRIETAVTVTAGSSFVKGGVPGQTSLRLQAQGTDGRIVFTFSTPQTNITVRFSASDTHSNMSNLILCRLADETAIDGGAIFNPDYITLLQTLSPTIIRTLGATNPNEGNNLVDDTYVSASACSYSPNRWFPNLWAGDASGTNTYSVSAATDTPGTWTHLETVQCRIVNANTSTTVTLDVGSRGAKTVWTMFATAPGIGTLAANQLATFVYDSKLDKLLYRASGIAARIPLSVQVALANELGCDLWINIPHLMNDASITRYATYIKANLNSARTIYVEYTNEMWNFGGGFPQTSWANVRGAAPFIGFPAGDNRPFYGQYALRAREIMGIFTSVWSGATSPALKRVLAFQAFGDTTATNLYRLKGTDLTLDVSGNYTTVPGNIVTNYSTVGNRPIDYCDALAYATYWSGHNTFGFDPSYTGALTALLTAADDYDSGTPSRMASALDWLDADVRGTSAADQTLRKLNDSIYPGWETIAASHSKPVLCYEGGCEIAAPSTGRLTALGIDTAYHAKIAALFTAYKEDNRFEVTASAQVRQFMKQASSFCPSWFVAVGTSQWSLRQGDTYETDTWKSWDAMVARTSGKEVFSITTA